MPVQAAVRSRIQTRCMMWRSISLWSWMARCRSHLQRGYVPSVPRIIESGAELRARDYQGKVISPSSERVRRHGSSTRAKFHTDEQENRVADMEELYETLATLHTELALPPVPMVQPHHFPLHLLPNRAMEETPGANAAHEKLLARVVPEIVARRVQNEADGRVEEETEMAVEGLKGVEPALGMLSWLGQVKELASFPACLSCD